uniref:Rab-GAP TBC domain-containing protein n=1 Tax=Favella ehrenbergii TaxID=182087 RepID=A0A7S3HVL6_9SPIT|mmetsp:Transcript_37445/g.49241  ORF Transcript_37445/g.49241 Transcript_37445/m.49241 type:complete len:178 (-) Transcript_37445:37-570(-)
MSYIAGSLLMHTGEEYLGFKTFANMMNRYTLYNFYSFDMVKVNIFFHCYMRFLKDKVNRLATLMEDLQIQCSVFLFEWVVALFSNIFSLDVSSRLWDNYLFFGDFYLMKICVAISAILERQLDEGNFEQLVIMFKSVDQFVEEEVLFKELENLKITDKHFEQTRRAIEATPDLERLI